MDSNLQDLVHQLIAAGLTQKTIAERVGCSQPTISDIAKGKVGQKRPSYSLVVGLQKMLAEIPVAASQSIGTQTASV